MRGENEVTIYPIFDRTKIKTMPTLHEIKHELETWLPAYSFRIRNGRILARHTNGHGATIVIKGNKIIVSAIGPGIITRLKLGTGGAFKQFAEEHYTETAKKVYNFLGREYEVQLIR